MPLGHSFGKRCPACDGDCLHRRYARRLYRFVRAHLEAYQTAYLSGSASSANELRRLEIEYRTLPPRHDCSCWCRYERCNVASSFCAKRGHYHYVCQECQRLRRDRVNDSDEVRGHGNVLGPETPMVLLLDYYAGMMVERDSKRSTAT